MVKLVMPGLYCSTSGVRDTWTGWHTGGLSGEEGLLAFDCVCVDVRAFESERET
jgi:hypothetical protein